MQVELSFIIGCLHPVTTGNLVPEFQEILFLNMISAVIVGQPRNSLWNATMVRRRGGTASFHTTRWMIVMRAAQSQVPGGQPVLAEMGRLYWSPLCVFACIRRSARRRCQADEADFEYWFLLAMDDLKNRRSLGTHRAWPPWVPLWRAKARSEP